MSTKPTNNNKSGSGAAFGDAPRSPDACLFPEDAVVPSSKKKKKKKGGGTETTTTSTAAIDDYHSDSVVLVDKPTPSSTVVSPFANISTPSPDRTSPATRNLGAPTPMTVGGVGGDPRRTSHSSAATTPRRTKEPTPDLHLTAAVDDIVAYEYLSDSGHWKWGIARVIRMRGSSARAIDLEAWDAVGLHTPIAVPADLLTMEEGFGDKLAASASVTGRRRSSIMTRANNNDDDDDDEDDNDINASTTNTTMMGASTTSQKRRNKHLKAKIHTPSSRKSAIATGLSAITTGLWVCPPDAPGCAVPLSTVIAVLKRKATHDTDYFIEVADAEKIMRAMWCQLQPLVVMRTDPTNPTDDTNNDTVEVSEQEEEDNADDCVLLSSVDEDDAKDLMMPLEGPPTAMAMSATRYYEEGSPVEEEEDDAIALSRSPMRMAGRSYEDEDDDLPKASKLKKALGNIARLVCKAASTAPQTRVEQCRLVLVTITAVAGTVAVTKMMAAASSNTSSPISVPTTTIADTPADGLITASEHLLSNTASTVGSAAEGGAPTDASLHGRHLPKLKEAIATAVEAVKSVMS